MFIKPRDCDPSQVPPALFRAMGEFVGEQSKNRMFINGARLQPHSTARSNRTSSCSRSATVRSCERSRADRGGSSALSTRLGER